MSSIPVVRRTTLRTTRTMKDAENTTARATRATTRGKLAGATTTTASTTATTTAASRHTAPTLASKAKAVAADAEGNVGKRKREALVEVTTVVNKHKAGAKGKEAGPVKPSEAIGSAQRVLRRVGPVAARVGKPVESGATVRKKDGVKPASRVGVPKVYRDEAPVVQQREDKNAGREEAEEVAERVSKRRHMEALQEEATDHSQSDAERVANLLVAFEKETAEPEPQIWEDLDADDFDDPLMVSEYVQDVCKYWKEIEVETLPKADYMSRQQEITWEHRGTLIDWLLQVHARFNLLPESLFLTVNLLDRFLAARPISLSKLQLVGVACFFVAAKFEETCALSVNEIIFLSDNQYTVREITKAEMYILRVLDWDLRCPGPMSWLRRGSKADECESTARTVAKYLLEIGCLERRLVGVVPSLVAAAALWLGRLAVGRTEWTPTLEHYATFGEREILPVAQVMLEYIVMNPVQHESLYKKYAHKKFLKCSVYMRQWALERWPENADIRLKRDIETVKAEIRKHNREVEEEKAEQIVRPAHTARTR